MVLLLGLDGHPGYALEAAFLSLVAYAVDVAVFPLAPCSRCHGGRQDSPASRAFRRCGACGGAGVRQRLGRRLWNRDDHQ